MIYILMGEDDFSLRQALDAIKKACGDPASMAANTAILDGNQVTLEQLKHVCETVPFLADKRLVIVEGLLERFEPKAKSVAKKKTARAPEEKEDHQSLAACITGVPPFTTLVLVDGKIGPRNPMLLAVSPKAQVKRFPLLRDVALRQWIEERVATQGGKISRQAVEVLVRFVGSNLWTMSGEIDKLVLFATGRQIEENDAATLVSYAQEASVFAMVDAILAFRAGAAELLLQRLLQRGANPSYLLVMLARQAQLMVRAKELKAQGKPRTEIGSRLGLFNDFALGKTLEQANKYSLARLKELYHKLLEADLSIKTGKYDGDLALNILVAELCSPVAGR